MKDPSLIVGAVLVFLGPALAVAIIVWAGGIWRELPLLRRLDRSQSEEVKRIRYGRKR